MRPWRDRPEWRPPEYIFLLGKPQQVSQVSVTASKLHDGEFAGGGGESFTEKGFQSFRRKTFVRPLVDKLGI
jgi:hypothetical protein